MTIFTHCPGCGLIRPGGEGLCPSCLGQPEPPSQDAYCRGCVHEGSCNVILDEGEVCGDRAEAGDEEPEIVGGECIEPFQIPQTGEAAMFVQGDLFGGLA